MDYRIILLFDRNVQESFLYEGLKKYHKDIVLINNRKNNAAFFSWLKGSYDAVRKAGKNDIIISWFDFQAVLCYWFTLFLCKPCKIIAINILLKEKNTLKNKLVTFLYGKALASKRVAATITSRETGAYLNKRLGINQSYTVLHDVYSYRYMERKFEDNGRSVFVGGSNGRDWETAFRVAAKMPDVVFYMACPEDVYAAFNRPYTNVFLYCNLSVCEFVEIQKKCSVTYLPLDTNAPAGLIVLYQAAALSIPVVISDTPATRAYISENTGCPVGLYDADGAIEKIRFLLEHPDVRKEKSHHLKSFLQEFCSEKNYINTLEKRIESMIHNP
jgi:glycosyltransferase involved in cell wall biosynthesis